ncbi:MAG: radical SAM protein [Trueperaceae bacterium]|nr:MAG: radical SAM protein [Trueperaceae bacterium]
MRLTIVHPCIGRRSNQPYIGTWQMEPLPAATLAGLTPKEIDVKFYDDRMEQIPFDEPTDLVAISVETYTARRSYELASEYRRRGVPVIMGGFHATLRLDEVAMYADALVIGEAEDIWEGVLDDFRHGRLEKTYRALERPSLRGLRPRRDIFRGKRYLPIGLVEAGRGCYFNCDFCAIQTVFNNTQNRRPLDEVLEEVIRVAAQRKLIFFVDDNVTANTKEAKAFFKALIPLGVRWVSQASINVAHDPELLDLMVRSGCQAILIGFESLNPENLKGMNKEFNTMRGGFEEALKNLRRHRVRLYITFVFGYDQDTPESFTETVAFAKRNAFYIAAFNHLTPFPGTPLYQRLEREGRLLYPSWWLDKRYKYNMIPFKPKNMTPEQLQHGCVEARRSFYTLPSIVRRSLDEVNRSSGLMFRNFFLINGMFRKEVSLRDNYPLGDASWQGTLLKA